MDGTIFALSHKTSVDLAVLFSERPETPPANPKKTNAVRWGLSQQSLQTGRAGNLNIHCCSRTTPFLNFPYEFIWSQFFLCIKTSRRTHASKKQKIRGRIEEKNRQKTGKVPQAVSIARNVHILIAFQWENGLTIGPSLFLFGSGRQSWIFLFSFQFPLQVGNSFLLFLEPTQRTAK